MNPTAPEIDSLLRCFDRGWQNAEQPSQALMNAMNPLYSALADLAPCSSNKEAKVLWITAPRGDISDYGDFEEEKEYGEVETYEEFEKMWKADYPDEIKWYRLVLSENEPGSRFKFRGLSIDNTSVISADLTNGIREKTWYKEEPAIKLCSALLPAARKSMEMLRAGTYNDYVDAHLPYEHRTGVILRSDEWKAYPEMHARVWEGMDEHTFSRFKSCSELNDADDADHIGRLTLFTANDFFRACAIGYRACGYDLEGLSPAESYLRYADGRDESLTGTGHGLNAGPGIDFDDASAWDTWYFDRQRGGGHPWEIIRGGNSTHVDLFVCHDEHHLGYLFRSGQITEDEYNKRQENAGYYFEICGKHRGEESIKFFVSLREAGLPVVLRDASEIMARYEGTDFIGIVPHRTIPKYCESMFPEKYGNVIDFMHVYSDEYDVLKQYIEWLPEEKAELIC